MLDTSTLIRVLERYAGGSFDELFDISWNDPDAFIQAANDYVHVKDQAEFAAALHAAVGSLPTSSR